MDVIASFNLREGLEDHYQYLIEISFLNVETGVLKTYKLDRKAYFQYRIPNPEWIVDPLLRQFLDNVTTNCRIYIEEDISTYLTKLIPHTVLPLPQPVTVNYTTKFNRCHFHQTHIGHCTQPHVLELAQQQDLLLLPAEVSAIDLQYIGPMTPTINYVPETMCLWTKRKMCCASTKRTATKRAPKATFTQVSFGKLFPNDYFTPQILSGILTAPTCRFYCYNCAAPLQVSVGKPQHTSQQLQPTHVTRQLEQNTQLPEDQLTSAGPQQQQPSIMPIQGSSHFQQIDYTYIEYQQIGGSTSQPNFHPPTQETIQITQTASAQQEYREMEAATSQQNFNNPSESSETSNFFPLDFDTTYLDN